MTGAAAVAHVARMLVLGALSCGVCIGSPQAASPLVQTTRPAPAGDQGDAHLYTVTASGKSDYRTYCAPCHGSQGDGDGPLAQMLDPRPARHSDVTFMRALSDEYLYRLLKEGGPALGKSPLMGAWGRILSEQRLKDMVAFMRSLAGQSNRKDAP